MTVAVSKDGEMAAHWKTQIEQCDKATDRWHKRGDKILKHYRDDREDQDKGVAKRLNLFWSNTETLKPVIYSKTPVAICERRFLDKDTTGRVASTILERSLRYEVASCGFDKAVRRSRNDYLTVARGQVWVRYNPKFGVAISPKQAADDDITIDNEVVDQGEEQAEEAAEREFLSESLGVDYVHWKDFYLFPASARTWEEVQGVGRKLYMSRSDMEDNEFEDAKKIELDYPPKLDGNQGAGSTTSGQEGMLATVFEIWWKPTRKVYFIAKSHDKICKEADDPLKLGGFFPCPEPLSATMTNDTMIPVPDYAESQDQYSQIDSLTKRIDILTDACKVVGVYDASAQAIKRVFQEAQEPNLIPVDSWAMFAEKGGIKGAIDWVPIEQIAKTLQILIEVRAKIIEDLDRTTGISDIMRGTSDARETMGGQRLKSNNSATRVQERQDDMARFCRDIICIMGEIIAEHFDPKTLIQVSGALYDEGLDPPDLPAPQGMAAAPVAGIGHNGGPLLMGAQPQPGIAAPPVAPPPPGAMPPQAGPTPPLAPAGAPNPVPAQPMPETPEQKQQRKMEMIIGAITLLRDDKLRGFRIDIETDSTVAGDAQAEKEARIQFVEGVTKFIETAAEVTAQAPSFAPLAAKMLQFAVRGFRVGRDLESAIEEFCDQAEQMAKEKAANPKPDAETIKAETEKMKAEGEIRRQQLENEGEAHNAQMAYQSKQIDLQMRQLELRIKELEFHTKRAEATTPEGGEGDGVGLHPHLALDQIAKAAQVFDLASKRNAAPRRIVRGPDGRASHVVTEFQEQ